VVAGFNNECCCDTKTALTLEKAQQEGWSAETLYLMLNNLISYHCDRTDDFTLTNGQLDRWADVAREFRAPLCSGVTYFVDKHAANSSPYDGYSDDPYHTVSAGISAAAGHGGDVVVIRTGSYKEPTTITKRLTLRASRGVVVIGQ
jgi:hypothetical protein